MEPVATPDTDIVYRGNGADVLDLPCYRARPGLIFSYWQPDAEELALLNSGGQVELGICTEPIPPVSVGVVNYGSRPARHLRIGRLILAWRRT